MFNQRTEEESIRSRRWRTWKEGVQFILIHSEESFGIHDSHSI